MLKLKQNHNLTVSITCFAVSLFALSFLDCTGIQTQADRNGRVVKAHTVYLLLANAWPGMSVVTLKEKGSIVLTDTQYYLPPYAEAKAIIHFHSAFMLWVLPEYSPEMYDCDDLAREMVVNVHKSFKGPAPVAFGTVSVPGHMLNLMVCVEGILLYDWNTDVTRSVNADDHPFFIGL